MCYHSSITKTKADLRSRFEVDIFSDDFPQGALFYHANGFEHPALPVITNHDPHQISLFTWGLIPHWVKDIQRAKTVWNQTLNARVESVFEKPAFRDAIRRQRCLVIADGFFESQTRDKKKYPFYIHLKNKSAFAFGGIWESWTDKSTDRGYNTFSIITTPANPLMESVHNEPANSETCRMPLILPPEKEKEWLGDLVEDQIMELIKPYPESEMTAYPVSDLLYSRKDNSNVAAVQLEVPTPPQLPVNGNLFEMI